MRRFVVGLVVVLAVACANGEATVGSQSVAASACHLRDAYPDPVCTPGLTNPAVTQATLTVTVCRPGWSAEQRPNLTTVKKERMAAYGVSGSSAFELDHLIPISVGGALSDVRNLFPEPWTGAHGAKAKDKIEARVHRELCAGSLSLADAQRVFVEGRW